MRLIRVRDTQGTCYPETSLLRATQCTAKGQGQIALDEDGSIWLELNYIPTTNHPPPSETGKAKKRQQRIEYLRTRDGDRCFYCLQVMTTEEMTFEHLLPKSAKGGNHLKNLVLAHQRCNERAGSLSVAEKVKLRETELFKRYRTGEFDAVDQ
jgi:hypothetical protein